MVRVRILAGLVAGMLALGVMTAPAAAAAPTRAQLAAAVSAVEYENVGGGNYAYYKAKYPTQINWSTDGCSVPAAIKNYGHGIGTVLNYYSGIFEHSCDRHDFGYRNYGAHSGGLALDSTASRRLSIDQRFKSNMKIQCDSKYPHWYQAPAKVACDGAADVFYDAVRWGGGGAFY